MQRILAPMAVATVVFTAFFYTDLLSESWWHRAGLPLVIFFCLVYLLVRLALYLNRAGWNTHTRAGDTSTGGGFDSGGDGGE